MIIKAVMLFLIGMLVLGMFGKLRFPGLPRGKSKRTKIESARKCTRCDAYVIGSDPCERPDCPLRNAR
jgi:hypothetical protein